jgi:hypothetical protein
MSTSAGVKRPGGVTFVMVLIVIVAVFNIAIGIWALLAPFGQNPYITSPTGEKFEFPGWYLVLNGLLSVLLGLMYFWVARMAGIGSRTAQVIIQVLTVINMVFALFRLPWGWFALPLNALILLLVSTGPAQRWFQQNP